jgi:hypothetical protein
LSDEQYAQSKFIKLHQYASTGLVIIVAGIYCSQFGVGSTLRPFAGFVVPLALIWFSDDLAGWAIRDSGGWLSSRNADTGVRVAGWLILLLMLVPRVAFLLAVA